MTVVVYALVFISPAGGFVTLSQGLSFSCRPLAGSGAVRSACQNRIEHALSHTRLGVIASLVDCAFFLRHYFFFFLALIILDCKAFGKVFCFAVRPDFFFIIFFPYAMCIPSTFPPTPRGLSSGASPAFGSGTEALAPFRSFAARLYFARNRRL